MLRHISFLSVLLISISAYAQDVILDKYIKIGLENNLALKQKEFSYQKSQAVLDEARGLFFPSIGINARYTRAGGGRTFDIPIGDLMNPVYQSLNLLLQQQVFPTDLPNESIEFFREKEHETKISLVQPVFQPAIYYNYGIKSALSEIQKNERNLYAKNLVAEIKSAYYNYLKTLQIVTLFEQTRLLLEENLRVSNSLFNNDKATKDIVYRAQAELSELEQQASEAEKNKNISAAYFNFLLNRSLDETIDVIKIQAVPYIDINISDLEITATHNREELKQLELAVETADDGVGLSRSKFYPGISLAVDYGFQGEKYRFTKEDDFWMASLVMQWNLFNGFQDDAKIEQAELEKKEFEARYNELTNRIKLEVRQAYYNLIVANKSLIAASERLNSAVNSFEIIDKKYREGIASQIEYIDARTTKTSAEINNIVTIYDYHIKSAELEKDVGEYKIED